MTTKPMLLIHPTGCIHDISLVVTGPIGRWDRDDHVLVNFFSSIFGLKWPRLQVFSGQHHQKWSFPRKWVIWFSISCQDNRVLGMGFILTHQLDVDWCIKTKFRPKTRISWEEIENQITHATFWHHFSKESWRNTPNGAHPTRDHQTQSPEVFQNLSP